MLPRSYNIYGGGTDTTAVFADVSKFVRCYSLFAVFSQCLTGSSRWRVQLMETGIALIDFANIDSMVQVHGTALALAISPRVSLTMSTDYAGVGLRSHNANSKAAAAQATKVFQDYYPEFLVRSVGALRAFINADPLAVQEILYQRSGTHDLDILDVQTVDIR